MEKKSSAATGKIKLGNLKVKEPATYGAGATGVFTALSHLQKERGLINSLAPLSKLNQLEGFDCPGCAWPDPDHRSKLGEFCENGAKAVAEEVTHARANPDFFAHHSIEELQSWNDYEIGKSGRLTEPMILEEGERYYRPIKWETAFKAIAHELRRLEHPDQAVFYTSGRSSNEAAFLYGLFARAFGTNNLPDCSNMCHESSGIGLKETLGIGKGSVTLDDFDQAELVIVMGQNPGTNHPRMLSALQKCKEHGGKVISINPLAEAGLRRFKNPQQIGGWIGNGTTITDLHLPVKINQDIPALKWIMKSLLELSAEQPNVLDQAFISQNTQGFEGLVASLEKESYEQLEKACGLSSEELQKATELIAERNKIIICWAMGLTQHKNGVENIRECVNLLLLKGSVGKPGAGTCPVRGHSNVQGDRTVGIMHHVSPALNQALNKTFDIITPKKPGYDTVHCIQAMHSGKAKIFVSLGGNFVSAASDTYYTAQALQNCELTVSISTKLNRTHLIPGKTSIILPTLGRSEADEKDGTLRFVTVENSMGKVHQSKGGLAPASEHLKSEPEIVSAIANAYFKNNTPIPWKKMGSDYDLTRLKMSEVLIGFKDYSERSKGNGFYLPNNAREANFSFVEGGKAKFTINDSPVHHLAEDEYLLMTIRSHDQFNTTIYGLDDRYRGIYNERRVVLINPKDLEKEGLISGSIVNLSSQYYGVERVAEKFILVPYSIPKGNLAAYFPETNVLIPIDQYAKKSYTPISKSVKVKLKSTDKYFQSISYDKS
ncbi:MAG: FdhF/YdeP family oxidoreductase [Cyclobacteriaceae bacterium]